MQTKINRIHSFFTYKNYIVNSDLNCEKFIEAYKTLYLKLYI